MIIDRIILHNFGPYLGKQTIELTPPSPERPVILIGALNGGGKTSLLDALQLCLYGQLARCSKRGSQRYEDYLRGCIHRRADPSKGAEIVLYFRHRSEGVEHSYRVHRMWATTGKGLREHLEVFLDAQLDEALTAGWAEHVERFLPSRLAPLFFFDGEQIEVLADPEHAAGALKTAVHSLLGLDLVDQLQVDLQVLARKRRREGASDEGETTALAEQEREIARLQGEADVMRQQEAALQNDADRAAHALQQAERRFRADGGAAYERRGELEGRLAQVRASIAEREERLRELLAGDAPLLLIRDLLGEIQQQHHREQAAEQERTYGELLAQRDAEIVRALDDIGAGAEVRSALAAHLERDREQRRAQQDVDCYLNLSAGGAAQLAGLLGGGLDRVEADMSDTLAALEREQREEQMIERQLAAIPEGAAIEALVAERERARVALAAVQSRMADTRARIEVIEGEQQRAQQRYDESLRSLKRSELDTSDALRFCIHAERANGTLDRLRRVLLAKHVRRVEELILESFQHLLRKTGLIARIEINVETWALRLMSSDNGEVPARDLSAGERQLLAVSILWGLARAAGRVLPVVVDTPLGRLDGQHRLHLVQRYFPHASHQVILLSTDKEIDEGLREELGRRAGRQTLLMYDSKTDSTVVQTNRYFGATA